MPATKNNTTTFPLLLCQTAVNRKEAFLLIFPFSKLAYALKEKAFFTVAVPCWKWSRKKTGTVILTDQTKMTTSRIGTGRVSFYFFIEQKQQQILKFQCASLMKWCLHHKRDSYVKVSSI